MIPDLPIEFVVRGTAISSQGSPKTIETWKETVKAVGRAAVPAEAWALTERVAVTIFYFPEGQMQGDVDNIVKPILDASYAPEADIGITPGSGLSERPLWGKSGHCGRALRAALPREGAGRQFTGAKTARRAGTSRLA